MPTRAVPAEIGRYIGMWWLCYVFWFTGQFAIGIAGVVLPALIASGLIESTQGIKFTALCAAVISGLNSLLKCEVRADRFHAAWRSLNAAKFKYENDENYAVSDFIATYEQGEKFIESAFLPMEAQPHERPPQSN